MIAWISAYGFPLRMLHLHYAYASFFAKAQASHPEATEASRRDAAAGRRRKRRVCGRGRRCETNPLRSISLLW